MSRFLTREELAGKIAYEGGFDAALDYGIRMEDMPESDYEMINAWQIMEICWGTYVKAREKVRKLFPEEYQEQL